MQRSQVNAMHHWRGLVTFSALAAMVSNLTVTTRSWVVKVVYAGNIEANKSAFMCPVRTCLICL